MLSGFPFEKQAQQFTYLVVDKCIGDLLECCHLIDDQNYKSRWNQGICQELGRLAQGYQNTKSTNTIFFIQKVLLCNRNEICMGEKSQWIFWYIMIALVYSFLDVYRHEQMHLFGSVVPLKRDDIIQFLRPICCDCFVITFKNLQ